MDSKTIISGKYALETLLGQGGWGDVYRARNIELGKVVSVKLMHKHLLHTQEKIERFRREARAASMLRHPGICPVFDYGLTEDDQPYYVMEFLEGRTLSALLAEKGRLPAQAAGELFAKVCQALGAAHEAGIVHRDITADNIMIDSAGQPVVLDFGLAKFEQPGEFGVRSLTESGAVIGTPSYMSPEQCLGRQPDRRSDIYSLGCVMYQTLCGHIPFRGDSGLAVLHSHVTQAAPDLRKEVDVPEYLAEAVMRALSKSPDDRQQTMGQLYHELTATNKNMAIRHGGNNQLRKYFVLAGCVALLAVGATAAFYFVNRHAAPPPKVPQAAPVRSAARTQAHELYTAAISNVNHSRFEQAASLCDQLIPLCSSSEIPPEEAARFLSNSRIIYRWQGEYEKAEYACLQAIKSFKQFCKPTSPQLIDEQISLVVLYVEQATPAASTRPYDCYPVPLYKAELLLPALRSATEGQPSLIKERKLVEAKQTDILFLEARFAEGVRLAESIFPTLERLAGEDDKTANLFGDVGQARMFLHQEKQGLADYEKSVQLRTSRNNPIVSAGAYTSLAQTYCMMGNYDEGRIYFAKAAALLSTIPPNEPSAQNLRRLEDISRMMYGDPTAGYQYYLASKREKDRHNNRYGHGTSPFNSRFPNGYWSFPNPNTFVAGPGFDAHQLSSLPNLEELEFLDLTGAKVTDADIAALGTLKHLKALSLAWTDITDGVSDHLPQFPQLEQLDLSVTPVGANTAKAAAKLTRLRCLEANASQFKDPELQILSRHASLERLGIAETAIGDKGLNYLARSKSLKALSLDRDTVSDAGVASLVSIPTLEELNLSRVTITGTGFCNIKQLRRLFFCAPIAETDLSKIGKLSNLEELVAPHTATTDQMMTELPRLKHLSALNLAGTVIGDKVAAMLVELPQLHSINLSHTKLTNQGVASLARCRRLEQLVLSQNKITDLRPLESLSGLNLLVINDIDLNRESLSGFANLRGLKVYARRLPHAPQ